MNAHTPTLIATRSEAWDSSIPSKLDAAVKSYDFLTSKAATSIKKISPDFKVEGYRMDAESTIIEGRYWFTPGTVFLSFAIKSDEGAMESYEDSVPMTVEFTIKGGDIKIKNIEADTSSLTR